MSILLRTVIPPKRSLCWQQWQPRLFTRLRFAASLAVLYPGPTSKETELLGGQPFHIQSRACSPAVFFFPGKGLQSVWDDIGVRWDWESGKPGCSPLAWPVPSTPSANAPCTCLPMLLPSSHWGGSLALLVWAPARVRATPLSDPLPSPDPASWPVSHHWNRNSLSSHWREAVSPTGSTSLLLWGENL